MSEKKSNMDLDIIARINKKRIKSSTTGVYFMVTIEFLGPIQKEKITLEAASLNDVATHLNQDEELKSWLDTCAVAVNDVMVMDLNTELKSGDRISLLPPVCGG